MARSYYSKMIICLSRRLRSSGEQMISGYTSMLRNFLQTILALFSGLDIPECRAFAAWVTIVPTQIATHIVKVLLLDKSKTLFKCSDLEILICFSQKPLLEDGLLIFGMYTISLCFDYGSEIQKPSNFYPRKMIKRGGEIRNSKQKDGTESRTFLI